MRMLTGCVVPKQILESMKSILVQTPLFRGVPKLFISGHGKPLAIRLALALALVAAGPALQAADIFWDGGPAGGNSTWLTATNWNPDTVPTAADNAIFEAAGSATTITIQMGTAGGLQQLGSLTLGAGNSTPRSIRNNNLSTFGFLELSGINGMLLANYSGVSLSLLNQGGTSAPMGLRLANSGEIFVGTDGTSSQILISSSISEINGAQGFTKTGPGILYLLGTNNTFTGPVTNLAGSIKLNDTATFGTGVAPVYLSGGNIISGADRSGGVPISNPLIVNAPALISTDGGTTNTSRTIPFGGPISGSGSLFIGNYSGVVDHTFNVRLVGAQTYSLPITIGLGQDANTAYAVLQLYNASTNSPLIINSDLAGSGSVRRQGATSSGGGTAILTGNNTYAGGTLVTYGTLLANNTVGSALGSGAVAVTNAGILGGNGTIAAPVSVSFGGTITTGASSNTVGILSISDLTLGESGIYSVKVVNASGAAGTGYSTIAATTGWTDAATSLNAFTIKLDSLGLTPANWNPGIARSWTIIDSSSASGFDESHFAIDTSAFVGTVQGIFSLDVVSGDLILTYTPAADIVINVAAGTVNQGQTAPTPYPLLTGPFGVVKVGNGEVVLTNAANDYLGSTKILAGTMSLAVDALNNSGALGAASTAVLLGNTTGNSNATVNISVAGVTMGRNLTVPSGSSGVKTLGTSISSGSATYSGDVALLADAVVATPAGSDLLISGLISGAGTIAKSGPGTLTLSAGNTHAGTTISNGTLLIAGQVGAAFSVAGSSTIDNPGPASRTLNASAVNLSGDVNYLGTTNLSLGSALVALTGTRTIAVVSNTLTLPGLITGAGGIVKQGAGTLAFTAGTGSDYTGDTTVSAGLTTIGASTLLGTGTINLSGGTLGLTGTRNLNTGILPNALNLTADSILQNTTTATAGTRNFPFGGPVSASGGTLTIRNIATGNFTNIMHLRLHGGGFTFARPVVFDNSLAGSAVNNTARLGFYSTNTSGPQIFTGVISGPGSVIRSSLVAGTGGTTILSAANTFTFGSELFDGELGLGTDASFAGLVLISGPLGTGTFEWTGNGSLFAHAAPRTLANSVYLNGVRDAKIIGTNALTFAGAMDVGTVAKAFTVDSTVPATISGVMSSTAALTKGGAGVLVLSGPNQNTGSWTVTNGTLLVNGTAGSGDVVVTNTGILGGTGTISGTVTVELGATLSPGASLGTLTLNSNLTLGGNALFEVNKSLTPSNDVVVVAGVLTNAGTGTITIANLGPTLTVGDNFKLFSQPVLNGSALTITGGGATWANNLESDGSITVLSVSGAQPPPNFAAGGIATLPSGNISLTATGGIGATYKLWATTNVALTPVETTWTLLSSGTVTTSPFVLQDLSVTNYPQRFYLFSAP